MSVLGRLQLQQEGGLSSGARATLLWGRKLGPGEEEVVGGQVHQGLNAWWEQGPGSWEGCALLSVWWHQTGLQHTGEA